MNKLIFAIMLLAVTQSNAQHKKDSSYIPMGTMAKSGSYAATNYLELKPVGWKRVALYKETSDTLEVFYGKIKFIKIGTDVFEITSPSLKKVEPIQLIVPRYWGIPNVSPTNKSNL